MFHNLVKEKTGIPLTAQARLQNNLSSLKQFQPELFRELNKKLQNHDYIIRFSCNEEITISNGDTEFTITPHQRELASQNLERPNIGEPIFMILGMGAGDELFNIFSLTDKPYPELPNFKLPIYIIEPDPVMLLLCMYLQDMTSLFSSGRALFFLGSDSANEFRMYLSKNRQAVLPTHTINNWLPSNHRIVSDTISTLNQAINSISTITYQLKSNINKYYKKISEEQWRNIFTTTSRPLRIMGMTSRFTSFLQYCMRDLLKGFEKLGHETLLHIEKSDINRSTKNDILATISEFHPDAIICLDHFRGEFPYLPKNIPFINWIQDLLPEITDPPKLKLDSLDFTFVFSPSWIDRLKSIPTYSNHDIEVLSVGINEGQYHPIEKLTKEIDVLYVSHLIHPSKTLRPLSGEENHITLNKSEREIICSTNLTENQLISAYTLVARTFDNLPIDELWNVTHQKESFIIKTIKSLNIDLDEKTANFFHFSQRIQNDLTFLIKTRPLKALVKAGIDVRIYGNNWDTVKELSTKAYGPAENGEQLNMLMNQSRICINNNPGNTLHMRALEILGAGSFMLSRDIRPDFSDIREYFEMDRELFFFKNEFDIVDIVKYWLSSNHADKREKSSKSAHQKAYKIFGYKKTAQNIINTISSRLRKPNN